MTREAIAEGASCSPGLVSLYHGDIDKLRAHIMRVAIRERLLPIIAQGVAAGHPAACRADVNLRRAALDSLMG